MRKYLKTSNSSVSWQRMSAALKNSAGSLNKLESVS
jgi:hypothetical protein